MHEFKMREYTFQRTKEYKNMKPWQKLCICQECGEKLIDGKMAHDSFICRPCHIKLFGGED